MSDHKLLLHDLLKEDQEPFKLKSYISQKRSQLKKNPPITTIQVKKHTRIPCFNSSPAMTPCKSPAVAAVILHVPSRTAAALVEAAMRIQKRKSQSVGKGLFRSFLKRLKDRSKNKKRAGFYDFGNYYEPKKEESKIRISCSSSNSCRSEEFDEINGGIRFCSSPFKFSLRGSSSSSARNTPEFCSPADSPRRHVRQEKEGELDSVQGEEEEEKDQYSPVSVFDHFSEEGTHEIDDIEEEHDYDPDSTYANVQRAKHQLLNRLRRFEKLAELDPIELERQLLEGNSDDEYQTVISIESEDDESLPMYKKHCVHKFLNQVQEIKNLGKREIVWGRIFCNRLNSWKEVKVDGLVGLDFREEWKEFPGQVEEEAGEIAVAIYGVLMEELTDEMFEMSNS